LSDLGEARAKAIEAHEEFLQHVEDGKSRIRTLSVISMIISVYLVLSYLTQLLYPLTGTDVVTVTLTDPAVIATEVVGLAVVSAWFSLSFLDYRFTTRLSGAIKGARSFEDELEHQMSATPLG